MKHLLSVIAALFMAQSLWAQITITAADMPVTGDMLVYTNAVVPGTMINPADSGVSQIWNYALTPGMQGVDTYQTAASVNILYGFTVGPTAFGYKVADSIPGFPVPVSQIYTFFLEKTGPARYETKAYAANISGLPTASNYSKPDVWYYFPLTYLSTHSTDYALTLSIPGIGSIKEKGSRNVRVDGWGNISTPYYSAPVQAIRVRSVIHEVDSITFGGFTFGIPRNTVEYKWLTNLDHYPALWVTSNQVGSSEIISSIRYRDSLRDTSTVVIDTNTGVHNVTQAITAITAYPNPAMNGKVTLSMPQSWTAFYVEVFDMQSKEVITVKNEKEIDLQSFPPGQYMARVTAGTNVGYVLITR
jgi:hypothetical protein